MVLRLTMNQRREMNLLTVAGKTESYGFQTQGRARRDRSSDVDVVGSSQPLVRYAVAMRTGAPRPASDCSLDPPASIEQGFAVAARSYKPQQSWCREGQRKRTSSGVFAVVSCPNVPLASTHISSSFTRSVDQTLSDDSSSNMLLVTRSSEIGNASLPSTSLIRRVWLTPPLPVAVRTGSTGLQGKPQLSGLIVETFKALALCLNIWFTSYRYCIWSLVRRRRFVTGDPPRKCFGPSTSY